MSATPEVYQRSRIAWAVLVLVLAVEVIGGVIALVFVIQSFFAASEEPFGQRISILLATLIAWVWVLVTLWGAVRSRAGWVRGSAITIHVLLFAAGTGILQLALGDALLGWALILLAFAGFVAALFARPQLSAPAELPPGE